MATVLMVDDSRTSRKMLRAVLERGNFEIIGEAVNGEEGYLKYKELKPDLVTMDITMPTMDGIESLTLIKHADANAKVVMITAAGQKEKMVEALYVAAGIGGVIAHRAFLAGAAGGCQAEIGSASAMAAGGVAYLMGGDSEAIANAAALALKNLLGLACDPVAGLVEVPCVKRNVIGAVNALAAADMTVAGIFSKIPPDEVIDAMRSIGRNMNEDIRETGKGGLAGTPTGVAISQKMTSL